ncbi:hypothetical protein LIS77_24420 [Cytobacillus firmus]|uniref:hypothetical protein n=1 Tax=Cytobacillus firmus TaxID=1399 RepID=UPI00207928AB|nr:hypothetical protein [Cytobacillus firmus]USK38979.1 hypothetical protein LIS77_24420 [Cytobacillus firmus]
MDDTRNEKEENQLQLRFERNSQVKAYALTSFSVLLASVWHSLLLLVFHVKHSYRSL